MRTSQLLLRCFLLRDQLTRFPQRQYNVNEVLASCPSIWKCYIHHTYTTPLFRWRNVLTELKRSSPLLQKSFFFFFCFKCSQGDLNKCFRLSQLTVPMTPASLPLEPAFKFSTLCVWGKPILPV